MSSYLYASSTAQSINGEEYEVRIIENTSGTDSTKEFDVGPQGVKLIYENTDDTLLLPGIVHSRCEVETLWPAGDSALTSLITNLLDAQDGDWLLEVLRDTERIWVGTILCEQVDLQESTPVNTLRIVATDGLSLLKNVDYNDDGTAYTGNQIVLDNILKNIQEKWTTWSYLSDQNPSDNRIEIADDVYSTDDVVMSLLTHPGGTDQANTRRMRIHTHAFSQTDTAGNTTFISAYNLLHSICLSLQLRLYYYGNTWHFIPVNISDQEIDGYTMAYDNTFGTKKIVGTYEYQKRAQQNTRLKGNEWVTSFTPQINEVSLTRDTNKGYVIVQETDVANGTTLTQNSYQFGAEGATNDTAYFLKFTVYIENDALSVADSDRLGRFVVRWRIQFDDGGDATYYKNTLEGHPAGRINEYNLIDSINSADYAPFVATTIGYNSTLGLFNYHRPDSAAYYYDVNQADNRYLEGGIMLPSPGDKQGVTLIPTIEAYDSYGNQSSTFRNALSTITLTNVQLVSYSNERLNTIPNFDWKATSTFGRGSIALGTTHIGGLGYAFGSVQVKKTSTTFGLTDNWVNQASATERSLNKLCVEEVLAAHYKSRNVERGNIVLRGTNVSPSKPFSRFKDLDTGNFYTPINWEMFSTACEMSVTLRKIGRDAVGITTEAQDGGEPVRGPENNSTGGDSSTQEVKGYGYNQQSRANFAGDWSPVIGSGETKEMYMTMSNFGQGRFYEHQGNDPASGYKIVRKVYVNTSGLGLRDAAGWTSPSTLQPADNATLEDVFDKISNYINTIAENARYTFLSTYKEVELADDLLDDYTGAEAAYSLRKLRTAYTGSAIRVRRTNPDTTEQDIGFTADGDFDTAALSTFCGGSGNGFVVTWYDQSGNGRNATQSTTTLQPQIYNSGSVFTVNGKPAIRFFNDYLDTASFAPNPNGAVNAAAVVQFSSISTRQSAASQWGSSSGQQNFFFQMQEVVVGLRFGWRFSGGTLSYVDQIATAAVNTQYLMSARFAQQDVEVLYDNVAGSVTNSPTGSQTPNNHSRVMRLGGLSTNTTQLMNGYIQEWVMWSNSTAHSQSSISSDINDYYSVY